MNKLRMVVQVGDRCVSGVGATPHLKRAESQWSPIFVVPLYLRLHPLMQNDQIRCVDTYGDWGRVHFRGYCTNALRSLLAIAELLVARSDLNLNHCRLYKTFVCNVESSISLPVSVWYFLLVSSCPWY